MVILYAKSLGDLFYQIDNYLIDPIFKGEKTVSYKYLCEC